tara:strand:- start:280 stop:1203 length:924 start_codon:yes stop_codon:yes gene_type:complete
MNVFQFITKNKYLIYISILLLLVTTELYLRYFQGFCDAPLFIPSNSYEYIAAPNQEGVRFGNKYYYNSFSQRSQEPDYSKKIILGLGDSVLNGGTLTDQSDLATTIFNNQNPNFQILNISAGSWGPDNVSEYIKLHGYFKAGSFLLFVSSHDAFDIITFEKVVGIHNSYPNKQYFFAINELFDRYLVPKFNYLFNKRSNLDPDERVVNGKNIRKKGGYFNTGFDSLKNISDSLSIPLYIYLHADQSELKNGKYNDQGRMIIDWAKNNNINIFQDIDIIENTDYRDGIHLNEKGQSKMLQFINNVVKQ